MQEALIIFLLPLGRGSHVELGEEVAKKYKEDPQGQLWGNEVVLLDDIKDRVNSRIKELHAEIGAMAAERTGNVDKLQRMFLLNSNTVNVIRSRIKNTDTDETILRKIYEADCQIMARQDAEIKKQLDEINALSPSAENYQEELDRRAEELVLSVPLQNRTALIALSKNPEQKPPRIARERPHRREAPPQSHFPAKFG